MAHTKIALVAVALLVMLLYTVSAADGNTDSNGTTDGNASITYQACTDSDGGADYYVKGDINHLTYDGTGNVIETGSSSDFCTSIAGQMLLREYYCEDTGSVSYVHYSCEAGIPADYAAGYLCKNGACTPKTGGSGSGNIKVTSGPSKADVYLNGQYIGKTPITAKNNTAAQNLSVGKHTIEVKLKGYNTYKTTVKVSANKTTPVHAKLKKISTKKSTKSTKKSTKATGAATSTISKVKCSSKSIIGDADGSKSITPGDSLLITNITLGTEPKPSNICCVDVDNDKDIDSTDARLVYDYYLGMATSGNNIGKKCSDLTIKTGKLKITTSPSKADAYIRNSGVGDWTSIGKTPVTKSLAAGSYEVSVKKKGYLEARQKVSVSAGKTTAVNIKLQKETKAKCTDSDGGKDYYVKGYATTDGGNTKYEDSCAWEASGGDALVETYTLSETYCDSKGRIRTESYKCADGCENGACIKIATCGNGIIDVGETCDGNAGITSSCTDLGYAGGTIGCSSSCVIETTYCTNS